MDTTKSVGKVAFSIVKRSKTKKFPDGLMSDAWKGLCQKYAPKTTPSSLAKLHKAFYGAKLSKGVDPDVFFTDLEDLWICMEEMGSDMSDVQIKMHILNNRTEEYKNQVTCNMRISKKRRKN